MSTSANINKAITAWLAIIARAGRVSDAIAGAHAEGRDLSDDELGALVSEDDAARAALVDAIEAAKS